MSRIQSELKAKDMSVADTSFRSQICGVREFNFTFSCRGDKLKEAKGTKPVCNDKNFS